MAASAWTAAPAPALGVLGDERLARLASHGERRAFEALYRRHLAGLTRYCATLLRQAADAEDAAQNAMVAALRALEAGTIPLRVRPWLYRIGHNEAIAIARRRSARSGEVELDEATLPPAADAEHAGEARERLAQLLADLRALTERQRQALVLRELHDFSYAEIATALGSSEPAAQQAVFEARCALAQFGEGRDLDCDRVRRALSDCDGMALRTRRFRAHLRECDGCRGFASSLRTRRRELGLLFPGGGATGLAGLLARLFGAGGGAAGSAEPLLAGLGAKGLAAVGAAVLAAGGGGVVVAATSGGASATAPAGRSSHPYQIGGVGHHQSGTNPSQAATHPDGGEQNAAERAPRRPGGRAPGTADAPGPAPSPGAQADATSRGEIERGVASPGHARAGDGAPAGDAEPAPGGSRPVGGTVTTHVTGAAKQVTDTLTHATNEITTTATGAVGAVTTTAAGAITSAAGALTTTATGAAQGAAGALTTTAAGAATSAAGAVTTTATGAAQIVTTAAGATTSPATGAVRHAAGAAGDLLGRLP